MSGSTNPLLPTCFHEFRNRRVDWQSSTKSPQTKTICKWHEIHLLVNCWLWPVIHSAIMQPTLAPAPHPMRATGQVSTATPLLQLGGRIGWFPLAGECRGEEWVIAWQLGRCIVGMLTQMPSFSSPRAAACPGAKPPHPYSQTRASTLQCRKSSPSQHRSCYCGFWHNESGRRW